MRSRKDSTKLKAILVLVDLLLVVAIAAVGFLCWYLMEAEKKALQTMSAKLEEQNRCLEQLQNEQKELDGVQARKEILLRERDSVEVRGKQIAALFKTLDDRDQLQRKLVQLEAEKEKLNEKK